MSQLARPWVRAAVLVTYAVMIATNALANALPINGRTTGEVSDSYPNLFAPAGVTFAIWGLIYLLLGLHVLHQLGLFHGGSAVPGRAELLDRVGVLFSLSSLANALWILTWHYDLILISTLLLATLLALLIAITRVIPPAPTLRGRDLFLARVPFAVYFGWATVATIANVTVWLVSTGWDGFGLAESSWTVLILAVGAVIGVAVILRDRDVAYALVLVWAYGGIWLKHTTVFDGAHPAVVATTLVCIAAFALTALLALRRRAGAR